MGYIKVDDKLLTPWIIGEYKWVKTGTKMPAGWEKVDIQNGFTLISGANSNGELRSHNHDFSLASVHWDIDGNPEKMVVGAKKTDAIGVTWDGVNGFSTHNTGNNRQLKIYMAGTTGNSGAGGSYNYAAGIGAELYVYTGNGVN